MSSCYHCNLPVANLKEFQIELLGEDRSFCCPGCLAVAEAIKENGLTDYYKFRTETADKVEQEDQQILAQLSYLDFPDIQQEFVETTGEVNEITLSIEGITCSACAWLIEKQILKLNAVKRITVNSSTHRAVINWDSTQLQLSEIIKHIGQIGYKAFPFQSDLQEQQHKKQLKSMLIRIGLSGLMTMQVMMFAFGLYFGFVEGIDPTTERYFHWISLLLAIPVVSFCSTPFYNSATRALKHGSLNMDVSISLAIIVIFGASVWATLHNNGQVYFESVCMFIFLLLLGRFLELKARTRATEISANILKLLPLVANQEVDNQIRVIPAKHLKISDVFVTQPGETIAADGEVISGQSGVNEAMLSGESDAVTKMAGSQVYAGTINNDGVLKIKVNTAQSKNLISTIVQLQDQANEHKPKIAEVADKISKWFVLGTIAIAILASVFWYQASAFMALQVFVAVLVATCPCAMSLATPMALTSAISRLNKAGILIRKANVLPTLAHINHFVFDKTGTLTEGKISIHSVELHSNISELQVRLIAASIEQYSEHPIAKAFNTKQKLLKTLSVSNSPGEGVSAEIEGTIYRIGNFTFAVTDSLVTPPQGDVFLSANNQLIASFKINDKTTEDAPELLSSLQSKGYSTSILSGDNQEKVSQLAKQLHVSNFHSGLKPADKVSKLGEFIEAGDKVSMVGDGINDAPVLAAAHVSFAVANATDLSKQGADVILLNSKLDSIRQSLFMSEQSSLIIKQNFAWAIGYNSLALPLAVTGILTPWMAVIGMSLSSLLVVFNSLRLNKLSLA